MLKLGDLLIHSRYDPEAEALKTATSLSHNMVSRNASQLILIGHGLGYLPRALRSVGVDNLIIWEPLAEIFSDLCARARLVPDVAVVCSYQALVETLVDRLAPGQRAELVVHPGYAPFCRLEYRLVARFLSRSGDSQPRLSQAVFSQRALESLTRIPSLQPMDFQADYFADQTALIVTTGPSLEACLPLLKRRKGGVVFAALQALGTLQRAGVTVDVAVAPDPSDYLGDWGDNNPDPPALLLAETGAHPKTLDWIPERTRLFHLLTNQIYHFYWQERGFDVIDEPVATVSETMLLLATRLGFSNIVLMGMDFCWRETRYNHTHQGQVSDRGEVHFPIRGKSGEAQTHSVYFQAARCMDFFSQKASPRRLCQYTEGRPVAGAEQLEIADLVALLEHTRPFAGVGTATSPAISENWLAALDLLERAIADHQPRTHAGGVSVAIQDTLPDFFLELPEPQRTKAVARCLDHLRTMSPS